MANKQCPHCGHPNPPAATFCGECGRSLPAGCPCPSCDFTGNPVQATDSPAAHQSLSFANFVSSTQLLSDTGMSLEIVAASRTSPLHSYPPVSQSTSAQDWNAAAARNNRVLIRLEPQ